MFWPKSSSVTSFPLRASKAFLASSVVPYFTNEYGLFGGIKSVSTNPYSSTILSSCCLLIPLPRPALAITRL